MKETLVKKLTSRKLWAALVGVAVGLAAAFGIDSGEYTEIAGVVTSCVAIVSYIFAESAVDKAAVKKDTESVKSENETTETTTEVIDNE